MSGQEALEEARVPSPAAVPAAAAAVTAPRDPKRSRASNQAAAAPDSTAQTQTPGPGARLHGRGHSPLPRPAMVGRALGLFWSESSGWRLPSAWSPFSLDERQTDGWGLVGNEWAQRSAGTRAQSCCSTRGTCFAHFKLCPAGGRWDGARKGSANGSGQRGGGGAHPAPPPLLLPSQALSSLAPGSEPADLITPTRSRADAETGAIHALGAKV